MAAAGDTKVLASASPLKDIPLIGYGTYKLKNAEAAVGVVEAYNAGYRHFDTAMLYMNEKSVGKPLTKLGVPRQSYWITTKVDKISIDRGEAAVRACLDESFKKLGYTNPPPLQTKSGSAKPASVPAFMKYTGYIDLVLLHAPSTNKQNLAAWKVLEEYKTKGLVKQIGVSNFKEPELAYLLEESKTVPYLNQIEVSPFLDRTPLVKFCRAHGIKIEAHSPLIKAERMNNEVLVGMAAKYKVSPAQILIKWSLQKGFIVIPRSKDPAHIKQNFSLDFNILDEDMAKLDALNENYATHSKYL